MCERILSLIKAFDGFPLFAKWQEIISLCKEGILKKGRSDLRKQLEKTLRLEE